MKCDIWVRPAVLDDGPQLAALLRAIYSLEFARWYSPRILTAALPLMTQTSPELLASGTYYVAEVAGVGIVACGGWTKERPGTSERVAELGHIRHFATHPAWFRRGLGRTLVTKCFQEARHQGVKRLECMSSLGAETFYRALGFTVLRSIELQLTPEVSMPVILMQRDI